MHDQPIVSTKIQDADMTTLKFTVPYFYKASYRPPRKQKAIEGTFAGPMEVEIESVSSIEAPVVVTITRDDGVSRVTRDFVAYEGAYYASQDGSWWNSNGDPVTVADFNASHLNLHASQAIEHFEDGSYSETPQGEIHCVEGRYHPDQFEAAIEAKRDEVKAAAGKLLFVDGVLHRRSDLPTIKAKIEFRFHKDRITIDLGYRDDDLGAHGSIFAIDQLAAAEAWAEDRASREQNATVDNYLSVEVHQPHLIPANTIFADEAIAVVQFVMNRDKRDVKELTDEYLLKFIEARRALNCALADKSDDNVTLMLETTVTLYEQHIADETARRSRIGMNFHANEDINYQALMGMVKAWDNRPVATDAAVFSFAGNSPLLR